MDLPPRRAERLCPVDQSRLQAQRLRIAGPEVEMDRCPRCRGVFLDADELLALSGDHVLNHRLRHRPAGDDVSLRTCPNCMVRMDMETAGGVELEACPQCHGLWLDRGELERLASGPAKP